MADTERRKSGPQNGIYEKILLKHKGKFPPLPNSLRHSNPLLYQRIKSARALWKRNNEPEKYKKFGKWVRSIRKRMRKTQSEFAHLLGVSKITIVRWENGLGHMAATWSKKSKGGKTQISTMERLENLDSMTKEFKKRKLKLEA